MNAILNARNGERRNAVIEIERTGLVSPTTLSLIQTERREDAAVAIGFSNGDIRYYVGYYQANKLPQAEQARDHVKGLWQDANTYLTKLKQPGFKMNPKIQQIETERDRLYADVKSIHARVNRIMTVINVLTDEQTRRERARLAAYPKGWDKVETSVPVVAKTATPAPAPVVKITTIVPEPKAKKIPVRSKEPKYTPSIEVLGGFKGLKEALKYKSVIKEVINSDTVKITMANSQFVD